MKRYWTSLYPDYINDWTVPNAIRELVQNCLDDLSTFEYDISGDTIELTSKGVELSPATLLMGVSGKRGDPTVVGGKGEGYKDALLVLLRNGHNVTMKNGSKLWTPSFEYSDMFLREVLCVTETELEDNKDLTYIIDGITSELREAIIHDCLYLQGDLGDVREGSIGRVIVDRPNKLYVGGLFVTDITGHKYSYDFHPAHLPLNRDRKSVDSWNLGANTTKLLEEVFPAKAVAEMVRDRVRDTGSYYATVKKQEIAEEAYNLVKEEYGEDVIIAANSDEEKELKKSGYENVETIFDDKYRQLVKSSVEYQSNVKKLEEEIPKVEEDKRTPIQMLEELYTQLEDTLDFGRIDAFDEVLSVFRDRGVMFLRRASVVTAKKTLNEVENIPF